MTALLDQERASIAAAFEAVGVDPQGEDVAETLALAIEVGQHVLGGQGVGEAWRSRWATAMAYLLIPAGDAQ